MTLILAGGLLLSPAAMAQMGPMGGGGGGPGGGHRGGSPSEGPGVSRPSPPRPPKPLKREKFDKAVTEMFRAADANRDGTVTLDELRAVIEARREAVVKARFAKIDRNRNGSIDLDEFSAWQRSMGSVASSEAQAAGGGSLVAETIEPELGNGPDDRILARLIEPLSATVLVNANVNYDAGVTLDELLAYERKRFDAADANHDGEISFDEVREAGGPNGEHGPDARPGAGGFDGRRLPPR